MNKQTNTRLKTELSDFNTSLSQLREDLRNDKEIEQNHFGDYLMIKEPAQWEKFGHNYKIWLNHPENVKQGTPRAEIEYAGPNNDYKWETITKIF